MRVQFSFLDRLTPRVSARARILGAAQIWSVVAVFLVAKGVYLGRTFPLSCVLMTLGLGLGAGLLKSRLVFDKVAEKIIAHNRNKPVRACLGGLFSAQNWLLIGAMILLGRLVSQSSLHPLGKVCIYATVGSGLGFSSLRLWAAWKQVDAGQEGLK